VADNELCVERYKKPSYVARSRPQRIVGRREQLNESIRLWRKVSGEKYKGINKTPKSYGTWKRAYYRRKVKATNTIVRQ